MTRVIFKKGKKSLLILSKKGLANFFGKSDHKQTVDNLK